MDFGDYSNSLPLLLRLKLARRSFQTRPASSTHRTLSRCLTPFPIPETDQGQETQPG